MKEERFPDEVQALFATYRDTLPDIDASPAFMPGLWTKIESRRREAYSFGRFARGLVTAAAAICLIMSAALWMPSQAPLAYASTYVDVLDEPLDAVAVDTVQAEAQ
jgi:hypothetical protein